MVELVERCIEPVEMTLWVVELFETPGSGWSSLSRPVVSRGLRVRSGVLDERMRHAALELAVTLRQR